MQRPTLTQLVAQMAPEGWTKLQRLRPACMLNESRELGSREQLDNVHGRPSRRWPIGEHHQGFTPGMRLDCALIVP